MKKLFFALLVMTNILAISQVRTKGDIEITPKIGSANSNYYGEEEFDNDGLSSVNFGVESDYFFNDRWSLHSGLLIQTMGSKYLGYIGPELKTIKEKLTYVTVPINANWHFGSTRKWYLNFGPSVGFLLAAKVDDYNVKDEVNAVQVGLNFGIGYKIFINDKFSLSIDYQGMSGLTEVPKDNDFTVKNVYSSFNIGGVIKL